MVKKATSDNCQDWELADAVAEGQQDAFRKLHLRYRGFVNAYIYKKLFSGKSTGMVKEIAEELTQEAFLRLFKRQITEHPLEKREAQFKTVLIGFASKIVQEYWAKAKKEQEGMHVLVHDMVADIDRSPEEELEQDHFWKMAIEELCEPGNWRNGSPLPHLAFHLSVFRRRQIGKESHPLTAQPQLAEISGGTSRILRKYLWLKAWTGRLDKPISKP